MKALMIFLLQVLLFTIFSSAVDIEGVFGQWDEESEAKSEEYGEAFFTISENEYNAAEEDLQPHVPPAQRSRWTGAAGHARSMRFDENDAQSEHGLNTEDLDLGQLKTGEEVKEAETSIDGQRGKENAGEENEPIEVLEQATVGEVWREGQEGQEAQEGRHEQGQYVEGAEAREESEVSVSKGIDAILAENPNASVWELFKVQIKNDFGLVIAILEKLGVTNQLKSLSRSVKRILIGMLGPFVVVTLKSVDNLAMSIHKLAWKSIEFIEDV